MDTDREVRRLVEAVTETVHKPVMDVLQVWAEIELSGTDLCYLDKLKVLEEVCGRFGI